MTEQLRLRSDGVSWREVDGEVIALGMESSSYFSTNASGRLLWTLLAAGTTRDELVDELVKAYGVDRARAEQDVDAFIADLRERRLLES